VANPKRVAAGKKSKRKGNNNEIQLAKQLRDYWGKGEWARTPSSGGWATATTREAFRTCGDIITTATDWPFCVEAKKQEGWTLDQLIHNRSPIVLEWWAQTLSETPPGMTPLLIAGRNHVGRVVIFSVTLLKKLTSRFADPNDPLFDSPWGCWPWYLWDPGVFDLAGIPLGMISLDNFLKIDPKIFGRVEDGSNRQDEGKSTGTGPEFNTGTDHPEVP
jgi:hypothetical protein